MADPTEGIASTSTAANVGIGIKTPIAQNTPLQAAHELVVQSRLSSVAPTPIAKAGPLPAELMESNQMWASHDKHQSPEAYSLMEKGIKLMKGLIDKNPVNESTSPEKVAFSAEALTKPSVAPAKAIIDAKGKGKALSIIIPTLSEIAPEHYDSPEGSNSTPTVVQSPINSTAQLVEGPLKEMKIKITDPTYANQFHVPKSVLDKYVPKDFLDRIDYWEESNEFYKTREARLYREKYSDIVEEYLDRLDAPK